LDWTPLLPGTALWALALYLPLSLPLGRFEQALADMGVKEGWQQLALVVASLALALAVGAITNLFLGWILGPGWGTSMGLIAVLAGFFLALGSRNDAN
jgi:hypothetical protein